MASARYTKKWIGRREIVNTKLQTDRQSWCDSWCCRREHPTAVPPHDGPWPAASSRQELAAGWQAGRSGREQHDRHPDHALTRAVSSPEHSRLVHPSRFLLCRSPSPMDGCEPRWHPKAVAAIGGPRLHRVLALPVSPLGNGSAFPGGTV